LRIRTGTVANAALSGSSPMTDGRSLVFIREGVEHFR